MEDIKKEKNFHMYFMVSIVLAMFMEIYAFLMRLNLLNIFIFISFIFYLWNQNHKKKQVNYLIQCCDAIIEQKDFSIIDGESKESLLSNKLYVLNKRYHQSLKAVKKEQLKLKDYIEDISHQLKTPITSIRIQTELILEENQNKKLYSIEHQIQRIQLLVNDLQTIALLDSHNIQYCFKEYDLQTLIDEIEENLDYLNPQIHLNKNIKVLCDEKWFIEALENGYDTDIGQRGVKLSGGQKQRLSIARVFLKNPPILIFDEATSALDNESEQIVQESLEKLAKNRTTLVIAHRLTTIENAEEILMLTEEGIKERGTHKELMKLDGEYAHMVKIHQK